MNILILSGSLNSGGAERVSIKLCEGFVKYNISDTYLCTGTKIDSDFYHTSNLKRVSLDFDYLNRGLCEQVKRIVKIRNVIKEKKIDVVLLISTDMAMRGIFSLFDMRVKTIACEHNNYYAVHSKFKRAFRNFLYLFCDKLVLLTKRDVANYPWYLKKKTIVMRNPLGLENPHSLISKKQPTRIKKLLAVGRLMHQKGYDRMLQIMSSLGDDYKLTIVGVGPLSSSLNELCCKMSLRDRVKFAGEVENVHDFYHEHDVLIMTSYYEGLPMVIGEANAFGLPVVCFNCPTGPQELIKHGYNGFLVRDGDCDAFVVHLNKLFTSNGKYEEMSYNAVESSKSMNLENISRQWLNIINNL